GDRPGGAGARADQPCPRLHALEPRPRRAAPRADQGNAALPHREVRAQPRSLSPPPATVLVGHPSCMELYASAESFSVQQAARNRALGLKGDGVTRRSGIRLIVVLSLLTVLDVCPTLWLRPASPRAVALAKEGDGGSGGSGDKSGSSGSGSDSGDRSG